MYQGVRNVSFSKNFAYVLTGWSLIAIFFRTFSAQSGISVVNLVGTTVTATTMQHKEVEVIV